jgi:ATP-dependent DNA ligase
VPSGVHHDVRGGRGKTAIRISLVIDGVAVLDGISDFDTLHSRRYDEAVQLYSFDILVLDGEDLRGLSLSMRKTNLARLLRGRPDGIMSSIALREILSQSRAKFAHRRLNSLKFS